MFGGRKLAFGGGDFPGSPPPLYETLIGVCCTAVMYKLLDNKHTTTPLSLDVYEVGVHIADVSYFVQAGSALDEVASQRATSVYLVQKVGGALLLQNAHDIIHIHI